MCGAQDWTRTSMLLKALPPQGSVSTNFTTWAFGYANTTTEKPKEKAGSGAGFASSPRTPS